MVKNSNSNGRTPRCSGSVSGKIPTKKQYKGVRMRSWGSWVSEIRAPNQKTRIWLGSYTTPEAAARAYDAALLCLKGSSASLNFPNTLSSALIPGDTLVSPKSVQRVAAAAATGPAPSSPVTPPPPPPPPPLLSTSSLSPSSSSSSDSYDETFTPESAASCRAEELSPPPLPYPNWLELDALHSPKYDQMLFGPVADDCEEEGDIRLWSFC